MSAQFWVAAHVAVGISTMLAWAVLRPPPSPRMAGQRGGFVVAGNWLYWISGPLLRGASNGRIGPMFLTIVGFVFGVAAGVACAFQDWGTAGLLLMWSGFCDILDGQLARNTGTSSPAGAFIDSLLDRLGECAAFMGLALATRQPAAVALNVGALIASYTVSYTRARGEGLGISCPSGGFERPGRVVLLFLTMMACAFVPTSMALHIVLGAVGIIALGASYTAAKRMRILYRCLRQAAWAPNGGESAGGGRQVEDGQHVRHTVAIRQSSEPAAAAPAAPRYT